MPTNAGVIGLDRWRGIEDEWLEMPGLTMRQAHERLALAVAVDALLEDLFRAERRGPQTTSRLSS